VHHDPRAADPHDQGRDHKEGARARRRLRSHLELLRPGSRWRTVRSLRCLQAARERLRGIRRMTYAVKEIYYTLQGEGANTGRPAVFLRFAGCNLWSGREEDRTKAVCQFCDNDLKVVYPQEGMVPENLARLEFDHFFVQPMDGPALERNTELAARYCLEHPRWRLSLQTHKLLGIR